MPPFLHRKSLIFFLIPVAVILAYVAFSNPAIKPKPQETLIYIQPLGKVDPAYTNFLKKSVKDFYGYECVLKAPLPLTKDLLAASGTRYEASKILTKFNPESSGQGENLLLITTKDIAHRKSVTIPEYGIFGLGFRPGKTCVVSTFRLHRNVNQAKCLERLEKVALHEIGHNLGLSHCTNDAACMMHAANGTIRQVDNEKVWFCSQCRNQLKE